MADADLILRVAGDIVDDRVIGVSRDASTITAGSDPATANRVVGAVVGIVVGVAQGDVRALEDAGGLDERVKHLWVVDSMFITCTVRVEREFAPGAAVDLVVVLGVLRLGQAKLLEVGLAGGAAGVLPDLLEDGEQDRRKDRDDGDDDEKLD